MVIYKGVPAFSRETPAGWHIVDGVEFKSTNETTDTHTQIETETEIKTERRWQRDRKAKTDEQADRQTEDRKDLIKQ